METSNEMMMSCLGFIFASSILDTWRKEASKLNMPGDTWAGGGRVGEACSL